MGHGSIWRVFPQAISAPLHRLRRVFRVGRTALTTLHLEWGGGVALWVLRTPRRWLWHAAGSTEPLRSAADGPPNIRKAANGGVSRHSARGPGQCADVRHRSACRRDAAPGPPSAAPCVSLGTEWAAVVVALAVPAAGVLNTALKERGATKRKQIDAEIQRERLRRGLPHSSMDGEEPGNASDDGEANEAV